MADLDQRIRSRHASYGLIVGGGVLTGVGMVVARRVLWLGLTVYGIGGLCGLLGVLWPLRRRAATDA